MAFAKMSLLSDTEFEASVNHFVKGKLWAVVIYAGRETVVCQDGVAFEAWKNEKGEYEFGQVPNMDQALVDWIFHQR